jgi:hypothetical protein
MDCFATLAFDSNQVNSGECRSDKPRSGAKYFSVFLHAPGVFA